MEKEDNPLLTNEMVTTILKFISNKKFASVSEIASHINLTEKDTTVWLQILLNEGIVYQDEESKYGLVQKPISKPPVLQLGLCGVLLIIISIFAFKEYFSTAVPSPESEKVVSKDPALRISPSINDYFYNKEDYPELIEYISDDFEKVNQRMHELQYLGAKAVIDHDKCDYVHSVIFEKIDKGDKGLIFIVDCEDKNRIYINEKTIINGGLIRTAFEEGIPEKDAIERCNNLITQKASPYGKVDIYYFTGTAYRLNKTVGNATVTIWFDVKNRFGGIEEYKARCIFSRETWKGDLTIVNRY